MATFDVKAVFGRSRKKQVLHEIANQYRPKIETVGDGEKPANAECDPRRKSVRTFTGSRYCR